MKGFSFILSLLVMVFFSIGCKPIDSGSNLTTLEFNTAGLKTAIDKKVNSNPKYSGFRLGGYAILIVGYNSSNEQKFQCYFPMQPNDSASEGCLGTRQEVTNQVNSDAYKKLDPNSQNALKVLFGLEQKKSSYNRENFILWTRDINYESVLNISSMQIQYDDTLSYYGYMAFACVTDKSEPDFCMYTTEKRKAGKPVNGTLNISIPLQWSPYFRGGSAGNISAEGTVSSDATDNNNKSIDTKNNNTDNNVNTRISIDLQDD